LSADENFDLVGADDMKAQFVRASIRFEAALATQGATLQHVVSEILFTTDLEALSTAAHVRRTFYMKHEASIPASTAVQVAALALPSAMLEIHPTVVAPE
jgi:enamine deaminase RidA (YjgF/YER057c/UK114 family)